MTTTKEDQMMAEHLKSVISRIREMGTDAFRAEIEAHQPGDIATALIEINSFVGMKACAESYEKKLAEKDAEAEARWQSICGRIQDERNSALIQLSVASARNAMLVSIFEKFAYLMKDEHGGDHYEEECPYCELFKDAEKAITANSESVAAWEAEKLAANKGKE